MTSDPSSPAANLSPVLGRYFERTWVRGEGHRLYDDAGRAYLDFACGIAVTALGHGHPRVNAAIHAQVDRLVHTSQGLGYLEPVNELATRLAATLPSAIDTVFFANSGTEAVEGALKLARRVTGKPGIVAFDGGFHGRTFGSASVTTSNPNYRAGYEPLLPGVHIAPFPAQHDPAGAAAAAVAALDGLRAMLAADDTPPVAAILVEPVQGEGGFNVADPAFLQGLRAAADAAGALLVADEVQTGLGRTGTMWAFEAAGVVPDVVCIGKALANGLPLAAFASSRDIQARWGRGAHGTTFGGNPVACAAGLAVLDTIADEGLVARAGTLGGYLTSALGAVAARDSRIADVRGPGLMVGVEFHDPQTGQPAAATAAAVIERCADAGLLLLTCGRAHEVVRWLPPIDVDEAEIDEAVGTFSEVLAGIGA